jgi:hypothetical protein
MDLKEVHCDNVNKTHLAQNKDQWWVLMNRVKSPRGFIKFGKFLDTLSNYSFQKYFELCS